MKEIRYPSGAIVSCGDLVWWNGGKNVGVVTAVYNKKEAIEQLAIQEPCLEISNELSSPREGGNGVVYPAASLSEEGIEKLTFDEEDEVRDVVQKEIARGRCRVSLVLDLDRAILAGKSRSRVSRLMPHSLPE